ncbi:MAG: response regulator [Acidimicrobiales bacterium]
MIRVVLADDQALVREGVTLILRTEPDIEVVADYSNGADAALAAQRLRPDIVLMDVRMPGTDGLDGTRRIRQLGADAPPVLMLTTYDDDEVLWGAIQAGAAGFVLKDTKADDLVRAVRAVAGGGSWLDPRVTPRVLGALRSRSTPSAVGAVARLSDREREVLELMASGANNIEIAEALIVSERTVKSHIGAIFSKLGVRDRAGAIVVAYEAGAAGPR